MSDEILAVLEVADKTAYTMAQEGEIPAFEVPDHLSVRRLYGALTRASKSLSLVSNTTTLIPEGT